MKLLLDSVMKSQSQPNLDLVYFQLANPTLVQSALEVPLVLKFVCNLFGVRTAFYSVFVNCLI